VSKIQGNRLRSSSGKTDKSNTVSWYFSSSGKNKKTNDGFQSFRYVREISVEVKTDPENLLYHNMKKVMYRICETFSDRITP